MSGTKFLYSIGLALVLFLTTNHAVFAATQAPYTQETFAAAQREGKRIVVDVAASWCPICAKQHPILDELAAQPAFQDLVIYRVDFDKQKDVVRSMGAQMQSTLIVFRGSEERGRSVGDTNPSSIKALIEKTN